MTIDELRASVREESPPVGLFPLLKALWWDAKGSFDRAHEIAQEQEGPEGAWVHAYLHRKEGDHANARYWYNRAHQHPAGGSSDEEWRQIASALLHRHKC